MNAAKFDGRGNIYAASRPSYPQEFLDFLYTDIGMSAGSVIADIGSGTGKLTRLLLERGSRVFAVEPNAGMRAIAEDDLGGFEGFVSMDSAAESTALDHSSVDFVTVATAFHWFDKQAFQRECRRILKNGGKVVIVYNSRDEESGFVKELYEVTGRYCPDFKGLAFSGTLLRPENAGFYNDFFAGGYRTEVFDNDLVYDERSFIGRCLSSSYALKEKDKSYPAYIQALTALFQKHCGAAQTLVMPNVTHCYVGTV